MTAHRQPRLLAWHADAVRHVAGEAETAQGRAEACRRLASFEETIKRRADNTSFPFGDGPAGGRRSYHPSSPSFTSFCARAYISRLSPSLRMPKATTITIICFFSIL